MKGLERRWIGQYGAGRVRHRRSLPRKQCVRIAGRQGGCTGTAAGKQGIQQPTELAEERVGDVDDPVPVPAPVGPNPATAVNTLNTIFAELGPLLNSLFPGIGSSTDPLSPGYPNTVLPGQTPAVPYSPGAVLPDPASF